MKKLFFFILLLPFIVKGQNEPLSPELDSLARVAAEQEDDSLEVELYFKIVRELQYSKPEQAFYYAQKGRDIAVQQARLFKLYHQGLTYMAILHTSLGEFDLAALKHDTLIAVAEAQQDTLAIVRAHMTAGVGEQARLRYEVAINHFLTASRFAEAMGNAQDAWAGEMNIAVVLAETERWEEAITRFRRAVPKLEAIEGMLPRVKAIQKALVLGNVAYCYNHNEGYDSALVYLRPAIQISDSLEAYSYLSDMFYNSGESHRQLANYDSALYYYQRSIQNEKKYNRNSEFGADYNGIGAVFLKQKQLDSAEVYLQKAFADLEGDDYSLNERVINYEYLSQLYEMKRDYRQAYRFARLHKIAGDSVLAEDRTEQVDRLRAQFEVEQNKRKATQLQLKTERQEKELVQSRLRQTFTLGGLGLVSLAGAFFFISQQRERKQKELVSAKNEQLNTLIKDHHHRFKNQYQFLTGLMDIESAEGRLSREVAKSYQNRMKAMRDMEDLLSMRNFQDNLSSEVEVQPLFERYRNFFLSANRKPEQILDFRYQLPDNLRLPLDETGNLLLIMSELATNSVKHNQQIHELILEARIEHLKKDEYLFKMRDNGRGWPKTPTGKLSLGTDIVEILVDNLGSSQKKTYNDSGAVIELTFKLKKKKRG